MNIYKYIGLTVFNTIVLLLMINIISLGVLKIIHEEEDLKTFYQFIHYDAYTGKNIEVRTDSSYVARIFNDYINFLKSGKHEFEYHPATEYQHSPLQSALFNIAEHESDFNQRPTGRDLQCPEEDTKLIYCFGGSTTLGSLVSDEHTWPSFLWEYLNPEPDNACIGVNNYGVASFAPTQETNQFIHLLRLGHRPSLAVFLDGINTGAAYDASEFSSRIARRFNYDGLELKDFFKILQLLPVVKLLRNEPFFKQPDIFKTDDYDIAEIEFTSEYNQIIANRFIENAKIRSKIAELYGIAIIQFLQPNAYINYQHEHLSDFGKRYMKGGGGIMLNKNYTEIYRKVMEADCGFIDLSYLFARYERPAIIDLIHYSPGFNKFLAENIIGHIRINELKNYRFEKDSATGIFFKHPL